MNNNNILGSMSPVSPQSPAHLTADRLAISMRAYAREKNPGDIGDIGDMAAK